MRVAPSRLLCLVTLAALGGASTNLAGAEPAPGAATPKTATTDASAPLPRVIARVEPVYPAALRRRGLPGSAEILCTIDHTGVLRSASVATATMPEFGESALAAVRQWKFAPGVRDGAPVDSQVIVPIAFSLGFEGPLEASLGRKVYVAVDGPVVSAESLPAWPVPIRRAWPVYPEKLKGSGVTGSAVVAFVINHDGLPVNPEVVQSSNDAFIPGALTAAANLVYRPVLGPDGRPLNVSMLVKFDLKEDHGPLDPGLVQR